MIEIITAVAKAAGSAGNCIPFEIGSKDDRLCQKLVTQARLTVTPLGYMLPDMYRGFHY